MGITKRPPKSKQTEMALPGENESSQAAAGVDPNPRAVIGANNPPPEEQVVLDFRERMVEKLPIWEQRIEDLVASSGRAVIDSEESAGKSADLIRSIRAMSNAIDDAHKQAKEPYLAASRAVDGAKRQHTARLDEAKRVVEGKQTAFIRQRDAELEKKRREAAARAREEAEAAAAAERARQEAEGINDVEALEEIEAVAAPAVVQKAPENVRSVDTGASVGGRKVWECEVTDYSVAVIDMLNDAKVKEAIEGCAKRRMKAGMTEQAGVRCWQATVARTY